MLSQDAAVEPCITIGGLPPEENEFCYLGAKISSDVLLDGEINSRLAKAMSTKARLENTVWMNPLLER